MASYQTFSSFRNAIPIDWVSSFLLFCLSSIGIAFVFSATYTPEQCFSFFFKKQALGVAVGFILYIVATFFDYRTSMRWGYFGYILLIPLLIFTLIKGSIGMGAQRWINLMFFKLQPSELAKILFPAFATFYWRATESYDKPFILYGTLLSILLFSTLLVIKQPDLGTGLIIFLSGLILFWLNGLANRFFIICSLILICTAPVLWHTLKPYQRNRIAVFLGGGTTQKERYQIEQATIAIGSGSIWGKGFLKGTQNKLHFLPESRTDFIFAVICEELGLLGALLVLLLYLSLYSRLLYLIFQLQNNIAQLFALGLLLHLILCTLTNIGMVLGLVPIVGIPLPFISYGLCNLWISFISLGCLQNIVHQPSALARPLRISPSSPFASSIFSTTPTPLTEHTSQKAPTHVAKNNQFH